jgi:hypothetical protein
MRGDRRDRRVATGAGRWGCRSAGRQGRRDGSVPASKVPVAGVAEAPADGGDGMVTAPASKVPVAGAPVDGGDGMAAAPASMGGDLGRGEAREGRGTSSSLVWVGHD